MNDDDDDDDEEGDLPGLSTKQKVLIGAMVIGGILMTRGRLSPGHAAKLFRLAGPSLFGTGAFGLVTHGGHGPDNAAIPTHPPQFRPSPIPPLPGYRSTIEPITSAAKSATLGAYAAVIRANISGHISDGRALELADVVLRVLTPRGRFLGGNLRDLIQVIGDTVPPGGIIRELEVSFDILRRLKVVGGGSGQPDPRNYPEKGEGATFGGMGDVMQANPKGIVNNLTRVAKQNEKGPGRDLVAQTADP